MRHSFPAKLAAMAFAACLAATVPAETRGGEPSPPQSALSFQHVVVDDQPPRNPWTKLAGDFNGDGKLDIAIAGPNGPLVWYVNPSWKKVTLSERGSHDILVADFNGDGRPDILGANHGGSHQPVELWLSQPSKRAASGPLRVHPMNPRYFTDGTTDAAGSLRAVYLTGSHTWNSLQEVTGKESVRRECHLPCGPASQARIPRAQLDLPH